MLPRFIPELQKTLEGRDLAIWLGTNEDGTPLIMPSAKRKAIVDGWLSQVHTLSPKQLEQTKAMRLKIQERRKSGGCGCGKKGLDGQRANFGTTEPTLSTITTPMVGTGGQPSSDSSGRSLETPVSGQISGNGGNDSQRDLG